MTGPDCPREMELLDAVQTRRWPEQADHALRSHVATCPVCSQVAAIASLLGAEWDADVAHASVPKGDLVWWRAQRRAREEAVRTAVRPVFGAQALALACASGLVVAIGRPVLSWFLGWAAWAGTWLPAVPAGATSLDDLSALLEGGVGLAVVVAFVLTLIPVYFAFVDD